MGPEVLNFRLLGWGGSGDALPGRRSLGLGVRRRQRHADDTTAPCPIQTPGASWTSNQTLLTPSCASPHDQLVLLVLFA